MGSNRPVGTIGDVGLSSDASHALRSMLQIIHGRSIADWQLSEPPGADVLLVGSTALEPTLHAPGLAGKLLVEVTDGRSTPANTAFVLRYPFRVMQLLDLLDNIAGHLGKHVGEPATAWATANALRQASQQAQAGGWQLASTGAGAKVWLDATSVCTDAHTLEQLASHPLDIGMFAAAAQPPPAESVRCARADFCWRAGMQSPDALPPWIDADTPCELRHWPDFGRLGASILLLDLCARLASQPHTPNELVSRSLSGTVQVHRFLAAASLAGWLSSHDRQAHRRPAHASGTPLRGWSRLIAQLRKRLA